MKATNFITSLFVVLLLWVGGVQAEPNGSNSETTSSYTWILQRVTSDDGMYEQFQKSIETRPGWFTTAGYDAEKALGQIAFGYAKENGLLDVPAAYRKAEEYGKLFLFANGVTTKFVPMEQFRAKKWRLPVAADVPAFELAELRAQVVALGKQVKEGDRSSEEAVVLAGKVAQLERQVTAANASGASGLTELRNQVGQLGKQLAIFSRKQLTEKDVAGVVQRHSVDTNRRLNALEGGQKDSKELIAGFSEKLKQLNLSREEYDRRLKEAELAVLHNTETEQKVEVLWGWALYAVGGFVLAVAGLFWLIFGLRRKNRKVERELYGPEGLINQVGVHTDQLQHLEQRVRLLASDLNKSKLDEEIAGRKFMLGVTRLDQKFRRFRGAEFLAGGAEEPKTPRLSVV